MIALHIKLYDSAAPVKRSPSNHPAATGRQLRRNHLSPLTACRRISQVTHLIRILYQVLS